MVFLSFEVTKGIIPNYGACVDSMLVVSPDKELLMSSKGDSSEDRLRSFWESFWLSTLAFNFAFVNTVSRVRYGIFCVFMTGNLVVAINCLVLFDWYNAAVRIAVVLMHIVIGGCLSSFLLQRFEHRPITTLKIHWVMQMCVTAAVLTLELTSDLRFVTDENQSALTQSGGGLSSREVISVILLSLSCGAFAHFTTKSTTFVTQLMTLSMFKCFDAVLKGSLTPERKSTTRKIATIVISSICGCGAASMALNCSTTYALWPVLVLVAPINLYSYHQLLPESPLLPLSTKEAAATFVTPSITGDSDSDEAEFRQDMGVTQLKTRV